MKSFNSRKGFSLIELLVVIGILAVLAAIAIPSVAGLIDRANKSADQTNANEMTNAIERFTTEYELVKQDIASGLFDTDDLDSVQGRVFTTFNISERRQMTHLETADGFNGYGLDNKSSYPINEKTVKKIITNYMKTSSDTFLPKQSDHSYFYSPELGRVVVAPTGTASEKIDAIAMVNEDMVGSVLPEGETIQWIDISLNERRVSAGENETSINVALGDFTYTSLRNDIMGYQEYESLSGGLFVPGTKTYMKVSVNGQMVDGNWANLLRGEYLRVVGNELENGPNAREMIGELVICKEISTIVSKAWNDQNTFLRGTGVSSVILEEGITKIGDSAFRGSNIEKLYIPSTVSEIGSKICSLNYVLHTIELSPANPYFELYDGCLYTEDFSELVRRPPMATKTTFTLHEDTIKIRSHAFVGTETLNTVYLNEKVQTIGAQAFDGINSIEHIYINDACTFPDRATFRTNPNLTFHLNPTNKNYKVIDGVLYTYDLKHAVANGKLPTRTLTIVDGCERLIDIPNGNYDILVLPKSVNRIDANALGRMIKTIYYEGSEEEFNNIVIQHGADYLNQKIIEDAEIIYNYNG